MTQRFGGFLKDYVAVKALQADQSHTKHEIVSPVVNKQYGHESPHISSF